MSEPIRWGICGTGVIAAEFVEAMENVDDATALAVGSNAQTRADRFGDRFGIERRYGRPEELADDPDLDVVYVASTQDRHSRDAVLFLDSGQNVVCEKPLALNQTQVEAMIAAASANDGFLMEALWSRFQPSYVALAALLDAGTIGEPRVVRSDFSVNIPVARRAEHRLFDPARGGGALLDLGIYPVQLAHFVLGPPAGVEATALINADGLDEQTTILLDHGDGRSSALTTSMATAGPCTAQVLGTEGTIHLEAQMHCTSRLRIETDGEVEVRDFPSASLHYQVPEVHRCLREGRLESDVMPHSESLAIMNTLDRIRSRTGMRYPDE